MPLRGVNSFRDPPVGILDLSVVAGYPNAAGITCTVDLDDVSSLSTYMGDLTLDILVFAGIVVLWCGDSCGVLAYGPGLGQTCPP